jgi:predicted ATPase
MEMNREALGSKVRIAALQHPETCQYTLIIGWNPTGFSTLVEALE